MGKCNVKLLGQPQNCSTAILLRCDDVGEQFCVQAQSTFQKP